MLRGNRGESADRERESRIELVKDLPRNAVSFVGIGANKVEIDLAERSLGPSPG